MASLITGIKNIFTDTIEYGKSDISGSITKVANLGLSLLAHPIGTLRDVEKTYKLTEKESALQLAVGGATNALTVLTPLSGAVKKTVGGAIASAFTKTPIKAGTTALIGAGALTTSPTLVKKGVDIIAGAPEGLVKTGETVGNIVEGTSSLLDLSSKDIKNLAVGVGAGAVVATGAGLAYDYFKDKKAKDETSASANTLLPSDDVKAQPISGQTPITPATKTVSASSPTKRKKGSRKSKRSAPYINIKIDNRDNFNDQNIYKLPKTKSKYGRKLTR